MALADKSVTSDKNLMRIATQGSVTISASSAPDADSTFPQDPHAPALADFITIPHSLSVTPMVRVFWDAAKNGVWYNSYFLKNGISIDPWCKVIATSSSVKIIMNTYGAAKTDIPVFYRLYDLTSKSVTIDHTIDKVFRKETVSGVCAAAPDTLTPQYTTLTIAHGQTAEVPIWTLEFSEDGTNWYTESTFIIGAFDTASGPPGGPYTRSYYTTASGYMDATNFYIQLSSVYATTKTIYVRYALDLRS